VPTNRHTGENPGLFIITSMNGIVSAWSLSKIIPTIPSVVVDTVFVNPSLKEKAVRWLRSKKAEIIKRVEKEAEI
jgi:hypothetical protein